MTNGGSDAARAQGARSKRGGLGRGLDSLIPTTPPAPQGNPDEGALREVAIDEIVPNPFQPRSRLDRQQLEELASSIRTHGLMQPLVVAGNRAGDGWTLIAGERRWRASRMAGLSRVPVVVMDAAPQAMLELALVENIARADLGALEEAIAFRQLIDQFGLSQQQVADRIGRSRTSVANTLRLLGAPDGVRDALVAAQITEGHARAILGLPHAADQLTLLSMVIEKGLNVRQTEALVRGWSGDDRPARAATIARDPDEVRIEDKLRSALGTRVALRKGAQGAGGSLTIQFFSDEQLQGIYDRLVGEELW
ncbi:MAG: ParB/RepB/Spo0J family partition protein [Chloroflexia bacterium]|nr:ParB/RepB/Spo0J family partition protein [Chloroflexia bacterium]